MKFTDLLNDYLDAKKDRDEAVEQTQASGQWEALSNSYAVRRYDEAAEKLNAFMEKALER